MNVTDPIDHRLNGSGHLRRRHPRRRGPTRLFVVGAAACVASFAGVGVGAAAEVSPTSSAAPAAAAPYRITGLTEVQGSDPAYAPGDHDPVKKVVVACPVGKVVLGGGVTATELDRNWPLRSSRLSVTQAEPGLTTTGRYTWSATVEESGGGTTNPWRLRATATCADRPPGYDFEGAYTEPSSDRSQHADPVCLPGRKLVGGGARIRSLADQKRVGLTTMRVDALGRLLRVKAHAAPVGAAAPWGLAAMAICAAENIEGYEIRNEVSSNNRLDWSLPIQSAFVACSSGRRALTAGAALSDEVGGRVTIGGVGTYEFQRGHAMGNEPYDTDKYWGFVLARMVCARADLE